MNLIRKIFLLFIMLVFLYHSKGQDNISLKFKTISLNPAGNINSGIMTNNFDSKGVMVFEPGIELSYEFFVMDIIKSVRFTKGLYVDGANQFAGYLSLGMLWRVYEKWRHSLRGGIGPALNYRSTWYYMEGYKKDGWIGTDNFQHYIMFNAGLEFNYYLSKKSEVTISTSISHPWGISISGGYRFWISRKIVHRKSCNC